MTALKLAPRDRRVIDFLRRKYPGEWHYYPLMHEWHSTDGKVAYMEARIAPQFDGDDNHFHSYVVVGDEKTFWREYG